MAIPPSPIDFPTMGCGTWAWGNRLLWDYDPSMDSELQRVFNRCVEAGVTLFDSGDSYGTGKLKGRSEELLGRFALEYRGANADRICLATKLAAYPWRWGRDAMVTAGRASADRLNHHLDLVQMHWPTANYAPWQENALLDGLGDLVEQGVARGVGLSNYGPTRLKIVHQRFADRGIPIVSLQVQYSLLSTFPVTELGLKDLCDELGIQLIAYSPLALGLVTGKYSEQGPFPKGLRGILCRDMLPKIKPLLGCLEAIAAEQQKTIAQVSLNWCIQKGTIPIPGAKTLTQVEQNIGALGWALDSGMVDELDRSSKQCDKRMVQNIFQTR